MKELFKQHIQHRKNQIDQIMEVEKVDTLFIEAGFPDYYFLDDQPTFFRSNPHFLFFCPDLGEGHILKLQKGQKPTLFYYQPDDFWHETSQLQGDFWEGFFDIRTFNNSETIWQKIKPQGLSQIISPNLDLGLEAGCKEASAELISQLHWMRIAKTPYEVECIRVANQNASKGHLAAKKSFFDGGSELETFQTYLQASGQKQSDLPYGSIIAFNEKAAVLHYQKTRNQVQGKTFLIDAGAKFQGYCSDITRTYFQDDVHPVFKEIHKQMNSLQLQLCDLVKPGFDYLAIQEQAHEGISNILVENSFLNCSKEQAQSERLSSFFFPHGIGHALGLQVHDVGGKQKDQLGTPSQKSNDHPFLRTLREIQEGDVLTIEPGLYFINMILNEPRSDQSKKNLFNWKLIDEVSPLGGIRIEDNVVAQKNGPLNLTRESLPN